jgi:hypothetical protein
VHGQDLEHVVNIANLLSLVCAGCGAHNDAIHDFPFFPREYAIARREARPNQTHTFSGSIARRRHSDAALQLRGIGTPRRLLKI